MALGKYVLMLTRSCPIEYEARAIRRPATASSYKSTTRVSSLVALRNDDNRPSLYDVFRVI